MRKLDRSRPAVPMGLSYDDEIRHIWGKKWGAQSEIGRLREVMMQKPGREMSPKKHLEWYGLKRAIDVRKAVEEHEKLVNILKNEGVLVEFMSAPDGSRGPYGVLQGLWGTRDYGFVVDGGAIVGRTSLPWDRGAEVWWAKRIMELGCPILHTIHGNGTLEGGNVIWLDRHHACIGRSIRTNQEGIDQASAVLKSVGVEEIRVVPIPGHLENVDWPAGGFAHLDCVFGYVDSGLAIVYPPGLPFDFLEYLKERDVNMIEAPPQEAKDYACNTLAVEPGKVVMLEGSPISKRRLEREGVDVITVKMSEFIESGGGPHCATAPLMRDRGPRL